MDELELIFIFLFLFATTALRDRTTDSQKGIILKLKGDIRRIPDFQGYITAKTIIIFG